MESTWVWLVLVINLKGVSTEPTYNFEPFFSNNETEELRERCTNLVCDYNPECGSNSQREVVVCANAIFKTSTECPEKLRELGELFYEGYRNLEFSYCTKIVGTLDDDIDHLMQYGCWKEVVSCLAPLHQINETFQAEHVPDSKRELCKNTMKLLENCDDDFMDSCKKLYQKVRETHYDSIECEKQNDGPTSGLQSQTSMLLPILTILFVLNTMV